MILRVDIREVPFVIDPTFQVEFENLWFECDSVTESELDRDPMDGAPCGLGIILEGVCHGGDDEPYRSFAQP